jgi:hypothetical protein
MAPLLDSTLAARVAAETTRRSIDRMARSDEPRAVAASYWQLDSPTRIIRAYCHLREPTAANGNPSAHCALRCTLPEWRASDATARDWCHARPRACEIFADGAPISLAAGAGRSRVRRERLISPCPASRSTAPPPIASSSARSCRPMAPATSTRRRPDRLASTRALASAHVREPRGRREMHEPRIPLTVRRARSVR